MSIIFDEIKKSKITTMEQIEKIFDPRQVVIYRDIICSEEQVSKICQKEKLVIRVSNGYTLFDNCVFLEDVTVLLDEETPRIEFSNCIFRKRVSFQFVGSTREAVIVEIRGCSINEISVINNLSNFEISYSTINRLIMRTPASSVFFNENIIFEFYPMEGVAENEKLVLYNNDFKCRFEKKIKSEKYLLNVPGNKKDNPENKDIVKRNFYEALLNNSELKFDRNKHAKYLFWKKFYSSSNFLGKVCIVLTGAFCIPIVFLLYAFLTVLLFGFMYFEVGKCCENSISILHAMYYSGITFTTLGYTEIAENTHQIIKLLSVVEAFMGVLISSCLITSIINKYTD